MATALPLDDDLPAGREPVLGHDRRVLAAGRRREAVAEAGVHGRRGALVQMDVDALPLVQEQCAQVVDAMGVVGVLVGVEDRIQPVDLGRQQLLAQVGRRIDQDAGHAAAFAALDQQRGAAAAVLGIAGIADAPAERRPRDATG